ncbi:DUF4397 domain-containing protein [Streptomyces sp. NPDC001380]|uniref:DUF4397 domain-containing protein n=1 Tax=Streptomyces sp. NPDC001380 TaxID=3364566 RepID=UPI003699E350
MNQRLIAAGITAATAAGLGIAVAAPAGAAPAADSSGTAMVSVFHGVPGLTVDVYANGKELIPDFKPGTLTSPMPLPAGSYDITIFKAGSSPKGTPAIEKKVDVPAGANATLAAHLTADGKPALDAFVNDVSKVPAGKARLTVRHVAAAPAVDVRAGGTPVFKDLENPKQASAVVDAGTVNADVVLAGTDKVAIGPASLKLAEGSNTVVYAWGSAADKNLALKVQTLTGMDSAPGGVNAGLADRGGQPVWLYAVGGVAAAGALLAGRRLAAGRR